MYNGLPEDDQLSQWWDTTKQLCSEDSESGDWTTIQIKYDVLMEKKFLPNESQPLLRGSVETVAPPYTLFKFLSEIENRPKWDTIVNYAENFVINKHHQIIHLKYDSPSTWITPRDFVFSASHHFYPDGSIVLTAKSISLEFVTDLDIPNSFHEDGSHVRGLIHISGFFIEPHGTGSRLSYITHSDPCGIIPDYFIRKIDSYQPGRCGKINLLTKDLEHIHSRELVDPEYEYTIEKQPPQTPKTSSPDDSSDVLQVVPDTPLEEITDVLDASSSSTREIDNDTLDQQPTDSGDTSQDTSQLDSGIHVPPLELPLTVEQIVSKIQTQMIWSQTLQDNQELLENKVIQLQNVLEAEKRQNNNVPLIPIALSFTFGALVGIGYSYYFGTVKNK